MSYFELIETILLDDVNDAISREASKADRDPTDAQKEAGVYRMGHITLHGMEISIENKKGSTRSGINTATNRRWSVSMPAHYGYIKGTQGKDKDHIDVYIGPDARSEQVFVVNQAKVDGSGFDEHKVMLGFPSKAKAIETYDNAFNSGLGPKLRSTVIATDVDSLKIWLKDGDPQRPFLV